MIYLDREAQQRVLAMFHFGLRTEGTLFLGSSESAEGSATFSTLDARHHFFVRRPVVPTIGSAISAPTRWHPMLPVPSYAPRERTSSLGELHYRLVELYAPPSVLVDAELDVLHVSERAGKYMQVSGGEPTRQILRLVHPALSVELRSAIYAARQTGSDRRLVRYGDADAIAIELRVRVADVLELGHGTMLITFDEAAIESPPQTIVQGTSLEPFVREIEEELHRTRDQLRTTIEQYETSLEELKASNEELQAINEELRSATEELETSKEELQSVNEELTTVNHELKFKVDEVSHANSDLQNLMTSTEIGVMFLDRGLNIKRFTPRVAEVFNIIGSDIGRPLGHLTHKLQSEGLVDVAHAVLQTLRVAEQQITSRDGRAYLVRWLPYRSVDDRIDGIVLTFVDVTDLRDAVEARGRSETALREAEDRFGNQAETALRHADRRRDELLATLAHELRNPLAPLKVALDVARLVGDDPVKRTASLDVMERQVGMLTELVDDLLDLSRLTHDKVLLERAVIDLAEVIERSLEAVRGAANTSRHALEVRLPAHAAPVFGDRRRLIQVFVNLLTNAIEHTPPGGRIDIDVGTDASQVSVRISDTGVGISEEQLREIFEIFVQTRDERGRVQGGLGLGLNVVRRLVELHGGSVSATSDGANRGSAFTVNLPLYAS